jgi:hypothetical protein
MLRKVVFTYIVYLVSYDCRLTVEYTCIVYIQYFKQILDLLFAFVCGSMNRLRKRTLRVCTNYCAVQ